MVLTGDEMLSDTYDLTEVEDGFFFEVEGSVSAIAAADSGGQADCDQSIYCCSGQLWVMSMWILVQTLPQRKQMRGQSPPAGKWLM